MKGCVLITGKALRIRPDGRADRRQNPQIQCRKHLLTTYSNRAAWKLVGRLQSKECVVFASPMEEPEACFEKVVEHETKQALNIPIV